MIVDAVGVCESDKTESRPLDRNPTVPLKTLLQRVIFPGGRDEDTVTTLAARLARLDRELDHDQRKRLTDASNGQTPSTLANALSPRLRSRCDRGARDERPDRRSEHVPAERFEAARKELIAEACAPFDNAALRQTLENLKRETEQAIDIYTPDEVPPCRDSTKQQEKEPPVWCSSSATTSPSINATSTRCRFSTAVLIGSG